MSPTVSVIIPNYNHSAYLPRRIETALSQTYQNFEVIILDDCSTDDSRNIINEYAKLHSRIRVLLNEYNSGSPFAQWNKGISAARGEYIWIAESDDYADPQFLETLIRKLEQNPTVGVVYCQSWIVDTRDNVIGNMKYWTDSLNAERWSQDYLNQGSDENRNFLFHKSTIPNASAVVFRKECYQTVGGADETFLMCGDWLHWIKMLEHTEVYFVAEPLNYFRRHKATTRTLQTHERVLTRIREEYQILEYILTFLNPSRELQKKLLSDYFERCFDLCPAHLKLSYRFLEFVRITKKVDEKAYYRLLFSIFKRFITYIPDKLKVALST